MKTQTQFLQTIDQYGHMLGLDKMGIDPLVVLTLSVIAVIITCCLAVYVKTQRY